MKKETEGVKTEKRLLHFSRAGSIMKAIKEKEGTDMKYLYETHCHTSVMSQCSQLAPQQMTELYLANGYTGVIVTEHFLNGNTWLNYNEYKNASYEDRVKRFCEGYGEVARVANASGLDTFFSLEYSYNGTDVLIYGMDEAKLLAFPEILTLGPNELCKQLKGTEYLAAQAHPYRVDWYIPYTRIFDGVEGMEVYNACRNDLCNGLAEYYAGACALVRTAGSDIHRASQPVLGGMAFDEKLTSVQDFIRLVREGKGEIVKKENVYKEA